MHRITALIIVIVSLFCPSFSPVAAMEQKPAVELANAHGLQSWPEVEQIEFTFQVNRTPPVIRHWHWNVSTGEVTRTSGGEAHTIQVDALSGEKETEVHSQFINDTFWLLFPFSIVWSNPEVTDHGRVDLEIGGETVEARKLTALWPSEGGYTPGDAYDLFIADDYEILAWTFRRSNAPEGKLFIWKDEVELDMLRISQGRYLEGSEEPFIELKDLRLKRVDEEDWTEPGD